MGAAGAAADSKDWIPAFVILTFCALASMASLIWATLLDARGGERDWCRGGRNPGMEKKDSVNKDEDITYLPW